MTIRKHANNFSTTLDGSINDTDLTLTLTSATGLPTIGAGEVFRLTLYSGSDYEIVEVTDDASSPVFTITRGMEGSTAQAWSNATSVQLRTTADSHDRKEDLLSGRTISSVTPASGDLILLQDASDGNILKVADFDDFAGGGGSVTSVNGDTGVVVITAFDLIDGEAIPNKATPVSGDKFLIQDGADSDELKYVDYDDLPSGGGGGLTPNICMAYMSTDQTLTFGTGGNLINFNSTIVDTNGDFDTTNKKYIPSVAGWYKVTLVCSFSNSFADGKNMGCTIMKNDTTPAGDVGTARIAKPVGNVSLTLVCHAYVQCNGSTDYIAAWADNNDTSNRDLNGGSALTKIMIEQIA